MRPRMRDLSISILIGLLATSLALAAAAVVAAPKNEVSITSRKFVPASITIQPGQTVVWTNNDDLDHTVEADAGSFKSDKLKAGNKFERKFDTAGTYSYSCGLHPREKAKVIVKK